MMNLEAILVDELEGTASELELRSGRTCERELEEALQRRLVRRVRGSVARQFPLQLLGWRGVGRCDIGVAANGPAGSVLLELKWGPKTLFNCAWDTAKLATALGEGAASAAYLVAGAPLSDWASGERGAELFDTSEWDMMAFLTEYQREFAFWRREVKTRPEVVPASFSLKGLLSQDVEIEGSPWCLRCARVETATAATLHIDEEGEVGRTSLDVRRLGS